MIRQVFLAFVLSLLAFLELPPDAIAGGAKCEEAYKVAIQSKQVALNISGSEASTIVNDIASKFGIDARSIAVIECASIDNAQADYSEGSASILQGEYVLYNPTWVTNVAGASKTELYAIFGHEIGHIANRHFLKSTLARRDKELEADRFAGCVVAATGGEWEALEDLLNRLRPEVESEYPSRVDAVAAARRGWNDCIVRRQEASDAPAGLSAGELLGFSVNQAMNADKKTTNLSLPFAAPKPQQVFVGGARPDVLGVTMGMEFDAAKKVLVSQGFVQTHVTEGRLELSYGIPEKRVQSQNYPVRYLFERVRDGNIKDTVHLTVASPLSGAAVFEVRSISILPEAVRPPEGVAHKSLLSKYGDGNPDNGGCWTWYHGTRVRENSKWSCIGFLEFYNMLGKDHIDVVLTASINPIDDRVSTTDITLRDASIEAAVQGDFQKYVESIFPDARVLSSGNDDPIKF